MRKTLGIMILFIWGTLFFYFFNTLMPKNILYLLLAFTIILITSTYILKKSGFNIIVQIFSTKNNNERPQILLW